MYLNLGIVGINADVWQKIAINVSAGIQDIVTPGSIRNRVTRNGGNILNILGILPEKKAEINFSHTIKSMQIFYIVSLRFY